VKVKKKCQVRISNRFTALGSLDNDVDINRASENIRENMKSSATESLGCYELKQHKPWFDEECSN
jgi:hypothetical protein